VDERATYRLVIDDLVRSCKEGQGQIGARRAKAGVWNANADELRDEMPEQHAMNALLARLDGPERNVLAMMLEEAFVSGVHETLAVLHEAQVRPFDDGYEGTPLNDFVGRLQGWEWPKQ
jgi:hypothetical protein